MNNIQLFVDLHIEPQNKIELFLKLCAINYANVLVKTENHPIELQYHVIKGCVAMLVQKLTKEQSTELLEEVVFNREKDCVYIRCYGIQFSFHQVNLECLPTETREAITNNEVAWDGIRLHPIAKELYELAQEFYVNKDIDEKIIMSKIAIILDK